MNSKTRSNPTDTFETIKLGIDAHAKWFYVARQLDGATPQPVQKMTLDGLLHFVARQQRLARAVFTCYEAGAFGYYLHRRLTEMGVTNYVVQPQDWDEQGKSVKNMLLSSITRISSMSPRASRHRYCGMVCLRGGRVPAN